MISPEISPLAKTGGLADAVGGLSRALVDLGVQVTLVMPAYQEFLEAGFHWKPVGIEIEVPLGEQTARGVVLETRIGGEVDVYLIRADDYFLREGLYGTPAGDYPDNAERFIFFSKAALVLAKRTGPWDILHCNDWQSALVAVYKQVHPESSSSEQTFKVLLTIHNLAYQGDFPMAVEPLLNLDGKSLSPQCLEQQDHVNFLKGGILSANALTTVSKRYADEIRTPEFGCGLEEILQSRKNDLYGIINGVDYGEWNPENDPHIKENYGRGNLQGKKKCKRDLQQTFGLVPKATTPLIGMVTRLAEQKGIDILLDVMEEIARLDLQLVILGTGASKYQEALASFHGRSGKIGVKIGFDNVLAHKIEAGADLFLMPSRYEPCGLNQIYSLKYGTIPVVRATGGLDDTIQDYDPASRSGNGFKFSEYSSAAVIKAVNRAIGVYGQRPAWRKLMNNAMACDFSWEKSAHEYLSVYRNLIGG